MASHAEDNPEITSCGNCGSAVEHDYCRVCGQPRHLHRSLKGLWHDFVHGVLHLDGKLMRTLPLLAFRPGELTRRYIEGKRRRFVSPIGMFLFSVFTLFLVIQVLGIKLDRLPPEQRAFSALFNAQLALEEAIATIGTDEEMARDSAIIRSSDAGSPEQMSAEQRIDRAERTLVIVREARETFSPGAAQDDLTRDAGWKGLDAVGRKIMAQPEQVIGKAQANSYKFSWLLIPLSVPFMWLLFPFSKRFGLYDHTMVVTYSLAFAGLFSTILLLLGAMGIGADLLGTVFLGGMVIHHALHLSGFYEGSWPMTIFRLVVLEMFIGLIIGLFLVALFFMGIVA